MDFRHTIPLVSGANRGLGRAIVEALLEAGVPRVYAGIRTSSWDPADPRVIPVWLDITDPQSIEAAARLATDVNLLVNNAGVTAGQPLLGATDLAAAEYEMRVNYLGPLAMIRTFAPTLARNGGGAIVNVLSILARVSMPRFGSYSASKAAALSLTQGVRAELEPQHTRVVGVLPAFVDTDMASSVPAPKLSAAVVAAAIVTALRDGADEVYPGPAADIAVRLQTNPRAVEQQFAAMFRA
jgi:NAD(P)-dependent dehydrogenase (short-subunit alcohol dehydrogenase family)